MSGAKATVAAFEKSWQAEYERKSAEARKRHTEAVQRQKEKEAETELLC